MLHFSGERHPGVGGKTLNSPGLNQSNVWTLVVVVGWKPQSTFEVWLVSETSVGQAENVVGSWMSSFWSCCAPETEAGAGSPEQVQQNHAGWEQVGVGEGVFWGCTPVPGAGAQLSVRLPL